MITTIYKCDSCGKEQPTSKQMWKLRVQIINAEFSNNATSTVEQLWCRACAEKIGKLPVLEVKPEEVKELTFEELVRRIVQEEIG